MLGKTIQSGRTNAAQVCAYEVPTVITPTETQVEEWLPGTGAMGGVS